RTRPGALQVGLWLIILPLWLAASGTVDAREPEPARPALADELRDLAERHYEELDTTAILRAVQGLQEASGGLVDLGPEMIRSLLRGEGLPLRARDLLLAAAGVFFGAVIDNAALLGRLVLLAVLLALLRLLQSAFAGEAVATAANAAVYLAMVALGLVVLRDAFATMGGVITDLVDFMLAMLPTLLTLMAG